MTLKSPSNEDREKNQACTYTEDRGVEPGTSGYLDLVLELNQGLKLTQTAQDINIQGYIRLSEASRPYLEDRLSVIN